jgi:hypothetical protein
MMEPNACAQTLTRRKHLWEVINDSGGLQKICCHNRKVYKDPPWLKMPAEGRQYQEIGSIVTPAADGNDYVVHQFKVPTGYDGVITSVTNFYTGAGFAEGSGNIVWRVTIGRAWLRNFGNIETTLGSLTSPCPLFRGGVRVYSDQVVSYYVNIPVLSPIAGGRIVCAFFGWFYPI